MPSADKEQPSPAGVLIVDKPVGPSSFAVVARVRRLAGGARTGHAGTLDPLASGVLVLALGSATKSIDRFMGTDKRYHTSVDLSAFTTTDDAEGERTAIDVPAPPDEATIRAALRRFEGLVEQRPPAYSAMKIGGRRAYRLARSGAPPELPPRMVRIHRVELLRYEWPIAELGIECGKGTYVRSIARDLGLALRTGGHCAALRRTAVGPFGVERSIRFDALPARIGREHLIALDDALALLCGSQGRI